MRALMSLADPAVVPLAIKPSANPARLEQVNK
jgi:hypothetical protein